MLFSSRPMLLSHTDSELTCQIYASLATPEHLKLEGFLPIKRDNRDVSIGARLVQIGVSFLILKRGSNGFLL
ncbi:uncharacterized [Tachysurus ichikawai]